MIVLDQKAVIEPHPVVLRTAHPCRIFFECAKARDGLARIEEDCAGAGDSVDIAAREGRDSGQMLKRVERGPFGRQHRPCLAVQPEKDRTGRHCFAIFGKPVDADVRIERTEECDGDFNAGHNDRFAAIHGSAKPGIRGNGGVGCHIAARAQIFRKHAPDELVEVEVSYFQHGLP